MTTLVILLLAGTTALAAALAVQLQRLRNTVAAQRDDERERIFELSLDAMCVTGFDASVKLVNPAFIAATDWTREDLLTDDFLHFVHADDREPTRVALQRAASAAEPITNFRNRILCSDGSYKMFAWKAMPDAERGVFYCVARDVTEDDQLVRSFVENIDQVVWVNDVEAGGRVLFVSPAYERIWGRSCASLYRNPYGWIEAIHPDDRPRVEAAWAQRGLRGAFSEEYRILRPDGSIRWIRDRGMPLRNSSGVVTRMVGLADDITEYKATAERLQRTEKLASIGTLAAGIAHEINNPIGGIQLAAQAALNVRAGGSDNGDAAADGVHRALLDIMQEAERCGRIVDNVLTFAREAASEKHSANFNDVVQRAVELERPRVERNGIELEITCARDLPVMQLNETELEQAIVNLIENASDARAHRIALRTELCDGRVRLTVEDDGIGMSPEQKSHMFEPFFTTRRGRGGTGLGLSITHGIVEDHGGSIEVETVRGLGTKMVLSFPVATARNSAGGDHGESARR